MWTVRVGLSDFKSSSQLRGYFVFLLKNNLILLNSKFPSTILHDSEMTGSKKINVFLSFNVIQFYFFSKWDYYICYASSTL